MNKVVRCKVCKQKPMIIENNLGCTICCPSCHTETLYRDLLEAYNMGLAGITREEHRNAVAMKWNEQNELERN